MHRKQFKISILTLIATIFLVLVLGALIFSMLEGWSIIDAFYFVAMTATTVGYGDFIPTHKLSKIVTVFYSLSIVPFVLYTFSIVAKYQTERVYRKINGVERKQRDQEDEIEETEKKINAQKRKLREQEKELDEQEKKLKQQARLNKIQSEELDEHEKELKGHQRKLKETSKEVKETSDEVREHDKELDVVEDLVGAALTKK
ncbi:hypothetical protein KJ742_05785 [Patescibacteria group bacterium]|nr:hypothetical protein [Patescibacteria group bacterium]MBU1683428.1 hypothetical protein [Patescibacteria group bacterium]MBU1935695.1 hypothetical protein [Patescibacteria group bacterium]